MYDVFQLMKLQEKIGRMSTEELIKFRDRTCNKCVVRNLGRVPCDSHQCASDALMEEEIEFRREMAALAKK